VDAFVFIGYIFLNNRLNLLSNVQNISPICPPYAGIKNVEGLTFHDLYEEYPDFDIDIEREQSMLMRHDMIVWQHPFYWYSSPALVKQWIDLVLEHGWAYGKAGKALSGKKIFNAISTGGTREAYQHNGFSKRTIREYLAPFEQTAVLCNMTYLPPYVLHGTHRLSDADIEEQAGGYHRLLSALANDEIDITTLSGVAYLNDCLPVLPTEK
jgi:glutathione-regulated potassium-efflux system ancillary protein KefG